MAYQVFCCTQFYDVLAERTDIQRPSTHESAILRFSPPPGIALLSWVKNSDLKTQLIRGSGSCGELTPKENQSSFNVDVPTNLRAPNGIVRSEEMESCRFAMAETTIYTALLVLGNVSSVGKVRALGLTRTRIRGLGLLDLPNFVTSKSQRHENSTFS